MKIFKFKNQGGFRWKIPQSQNLPLILHLFFGGLLIGWGCYGAFFLAYTSLLTFFYNSTKMKLLIGNRSIFRCIASLLCTFFDFFGVSGMKRFLKSSLSLILAITIIFSSAVVGFSRVDFSGLFAVKAEAASSGTCGDNLTWTLDDDGTLTISGTGKMKDYSYSSTAPWYSLHSRVKSVVINNGVTSIGDYSFDDAQALHQSQFLIV